MVAACVCVCVLCVYVCACVCVHVLVCSSESRRVLGSPRVMPCIACTSMHLHAVTNKISNPYRVFSGENALVKEVMDYKHLVGHASLFIYFSSFLNVSLQQLHDFSKRNDSLLPYQKPVLDI